MKRLVRGLFLAAERSGGPSGRAVIVDPRGRRVANSWIVQTFLTPDRAGEMVARYRAGEGVKALAAEYGVHRSTVWRHIGRSGASTG